MSETPSEDRLAELDRARRTARDRFADDLVATRHRLSPANLRDELIDRAVDAAHDATRTGLSLVARHKRITIATGAVATLAVFHRPLLRWGKKGRNFIAAKIAK